jgi:hypothetical protein
VEVEKLKNNISGRRIDFGRIKLELGRTNSELKNQGIGLIRFDTQKVGPPIQTFEP